MENFKLEQNIWSDEDFARMQWHDCAIYAIAFPKIKDVFEIWLDIDYLVQWVKPVPPANNFNFWISPATLLFENTRNMRCDFDTLNGIEIDSITRENPVHLLNASGNKRVEWNWTISCHSGDLNFQATGFRQYARKPPVFSKLAQLGRGEFFQPSFEQKFQANEEEN